MGRKRKAIPPGYTFSRLTFIRETEPKHKEWFGLFKCQCGEISEIRIKAVRYGRQQSCGCKKVEVLQARRKNPVRVEREKPTYVTDEMLGFLGSPFDFSLRELNK